MSPEPPPFPAAWFVIISTDLRLVFRHFGLWNSKLKKTKKKKQKLKSTTKQFYDYFIFIFCILPRQKKTSRRLKHKSCRKMAEVHRVFGTLAANNLLAIQCLWHFQLSTTQQPEVPLSTANQSTDWGKILSAERNGRLAGTGTAAYHIHRQSVSASASAAVEKYAYACITRSNG